MKKLISSLLICIIILALSVPAFAANVNVSGKKTALSLTDTYLVDIDISGNPGIMGFKIIVKYDAEKVDIVSVTKGTVTNKGNFISSFGNTDGEFNVVWNNTSEIKDNGSLFVLGVKAKKNFDSSKIALSFSQTDTFNEQYKDVVLNCNNIEVSCKKGVEPTTETVTQAKIKSEQKSNEKTIAPANSEQIKDAVDIALKDKNYKKISDVEKTDTAFVSKANKNIEKTSGEKDKFRNVTEVQRAYNSAVEEEYIKTLQDSASPESIKAAIEKAMISCSITSLDNIDKKDLPKFLKAVEKELSALDKNIPRLTDKVDDATALKIIKKLYGSVELTESKIDVKKEVQHKNEVNKRIIIIVAVISALLIAAVVTIVILKRKKKK